MHGMIMDMLKRFVIETYDDATWKQLQENAGLKNKVYFPVINYDDSETVQLVVTASEMTGIPLQTLLQVFGEYIAEDLIVMSKVLIRPEWKTLDFLENIETIFHALVRDVWRVHPPILDFVRTGENEITLNYASKRKMCSVAKGIVTGVGKYYGEPIGFREGTCMLRGANSCQIHFYVEGKQQPARTATKRKFAVA
jgi:hypothetical protein